MPEDAKMRMTDYLTRNPKDKVEVERSRMLCPEQKQCYHGQLFFAEWIPKLRNICLGIITHDIYQMVAYKGKSREEVTEALMHSDIEELRMRDDSIEIKRRREMIRD